MCDGGRIEDWRPAGDAETVTDLPTVVPQFRAAAGYMAIIVGILQLLMGMLRMGVLVNFVADSVVIGFTAGAGVLIAANQMRHLLRLDMTNYPEFVLTVKAAVETIGTTHPASVAVGVGTMAVLVLVNALLLWIYPLDGGERVLTDVGRMEADTG